jgi:hypothetical protein
MEIEKKFLGGCLNCNFETTNRAELKAHNCTETMENTWEQFQKELQKENAGLNQADRNALHLALIEDFSNVIAKHLPNFDNNISADTWKLLELFTEETIHQLTDPALNCECGYQH